MRSPISLLATAVLLLGLAATTAAAPSDPFQGAWRSIDAVDGSAQKLSFGGSGAARSATLNDAGATVCGYPAVDASTTAIGLGTVAGNTISVEWSGRCHPGSDTWSATVEYTWHPGTNTLTENISATIWSRP